MGWGSIDWPYRKEPGLVTAVQWLPEAGPVCPRGYLSSPPPRPGGTESRRSVVGEDRWHLPEDLPSGISREPVMCVFITPQLEGGDPGLLGGLLQGPGERAL